MTEIPFDLPRATALLDQLIKQTVSATTHARLCADGVRRDPRAFTDGAADDYDAEADELVEEADLLHAISRRLVAGERDRERLDWLNEELTGGSLDHAVAIVRELHRRSDWVGLRNAVSAMRMERTARSSEGSPTNG